MKKIITSVSALLLVISVFFAFAACNQEPVTPGNTDYVITAENCGVTVKDAETVVIKVTQEIFDMLDSDKQFLANYMTLLKDADVFSFAASESSYGLFVSTINGKTANSASEYWRLCSDDTEFTDPEGEYNTPVVIDGKTFLSTALGVSALPIKVGSSYLFVLTSF